MEFHNIGRIDLEDSHWEVRDGVLIAERRNGWALQLVIGDITWKDYTVECDINLIELFPNQVSNNGAGIIFRRLDNNNVIGFDSYMLPTPSIWGWVWKDARFVSDVKKPFSLKLGEWYRFKVVALGNQLSFFIDDNLAMELQNNWIQNGFVGINISGAKAQYDNFAISGDGVPDMDMSLGVEPGEKLPAFWSQIRRWIK